MIEKKTSEGKVPTTQKEKDTFRIPRGRMNQFAQQTMPENARATVPLNGPPVELMPEMFDELESSDETKTNSAGR